MLNSAPNRSLGDWTYIALYGGLGLLCIAFVASQYVHPNLGTDKFTLLYLTRIGPLQTVMGLCLISFAAMKYRSTRTP